ncbi:serine/threonine-protein kinase [Nonomuraea sp. NPDC059007]|uniref:serine/threonine-protein kinase n=1 Tax=Nonomuraea sp. NPDC059007 TaxID=3346692 RepID=UPI0036C5249D
MKTIQGRYQLTKPIGRGGMGAVWEGMDTRLNRSIAVKLIYKPDLLSENEAIRRFNREARITARLRHPGVPVLYDFGTEGTDLFMVMEYVDGHTVADLISEHSPLPISWTALIGAQVCAVLTAAHRVGLLHRDIKPANLVVCPNGSVKVIDFGIATSLGAKEFSQITESGQIPGTARYMAPELVDGEQASPASDLYTVGCLLYELLAGARPFASRDVIVEITRHRGDEPPSIERPDLPTGLEALTRRLLAKTPDGRPADAEETFVELLPFAGDAPSIPGLTPHNLIGDPFHMYARAIQALRT